MPTYEYQCDNCSAVIEFLQGRDEKPKKKCPACGKHKLFRLYSFHFSVRNVNSVGQLAEQNTKKMGKAKVEEVMAKKKEVEAAPSIWGKTISRKEKQPWWRKGRINPKLLRQDYSDVQKGDSHSPFPTQSKALTDYIEKGTI